MNPRQYISLGMMAARKDRSIYPGHNHRTKRDTGKFYVTYSGDESFRLELDEAEVAELLELGLIRKEWPDTELKCYVLAEVTAAPSRQKAG